MPKTRAGCVGRPRPCPWTRCRYHLACEAKGEPLESCALDVADRGGVSQAEIGRILGLTKERIRQIEAKALEQARALLAAEGIRNPSDLAPDGFDYVQRHRSEGLPVTIADLTEADGGDTEGLNDSRGDAA